VGDAGANEAQSWHRAVSEFERGVEVRVVEAGSLVEVAPVQADRAGDVGLRKV
jgi:hypothetical protein